MNKRLILLLPLVIFVALAALLMRGLQLDSDLLPSALIGKPFPEFELPTLDGDTTVSKTLVLGDVSLVNVWATWCISCRAEHAQLNTLAAQGVRVIGLNYKDQQPKAQAWLRDLGNPYNTVIYDQAGRLGFDLGVYGAPETYIVDRNGIIRYKHVGVISPRDWDTTMKPIYLGLKDNS